MSLPLDSAPATAPAAAAAAVESTSIQQHQCSDTMQQLVSREPLPDEEAADEEDQEPHSFKAKLKRRTTLSKPSRQAAQPASSDSNLALPLPISGESPVTPGRQRAKVKSANRTILDPSGSLYYHWSMVVSFAFLYNFWSLSYRFAFREIDFDSVAFWFALDYSADLIYLLDVVINFHTGYLEDGVLQRNIDKIGLHYRESTLFYLDCLCLLPLDVLYLSIGFSSILRCTRLVKIYKFWSYVDRTERHTNYPNVFRTFTLVHYILVIFHWNACLFYMISKNKILDIETLYKINDNRCADIPCQYLHAFYWSVLALTTIGDLPRPRTKGEYVYVIVELLFGLFLLASVLGHVANIVTNVSAARKEFQAKLDAVKTFMRMRRVSDELQNKVIRWFDYLWISQQSSDDDRSVGCLPDRLKAEIAIHVHLDTLKRVDIFQNTEAGFLCELVLRLKPVLFSPGDYVCRKNEVGHEMYIVSRGILEVVTEKGDMVVATLKAGSYFGEISVLNVGLAGNKRTASVRSVGYSDLFCLNKQDLWDVLKNYPNAESRIRARAEERLSKLDINHSNSNLKNHQLSVPMSSSSRAPSRSQLRRILNQVTPACSAHSKKTLGSCCRHRSSHRSRAYTGSVISNNSDCNTQSFHPSIVSCSRSFEVSEKAARRRPASPASSHNSSIRLDRPASGLMDGPWLESQGHVKLPVSPDSGRSGANWPDKDSGQGHSHQAPATRPSLGSVSSSLGVWQARQPSMEAEPEESGEWEHRSGRLFNRPRAHHPCHTCWFDRSPQPQTLCPPTGAYWLPSGGQHPAAAAAAVPVIQIPLLATCSTPNGQYQMLQPVVTAHGQQSMSMTHLSRSGNHPQTGANFLMLGSDIQLNDPTPASPMLAPASAILPLQDSTPSSLARTRKTILSSSSNLTPERAIDIERRNSNGTQTSSRFMEDPRT